MVFIRGRKIVVVSSEVYIIGPSQWPVSNKLGAVVFLRNHGEYRYVSTHPVTPTRNPGITLRHDIVVFDRIT